MCDLLRIMKLELYAVPKVYAWFNVVSIRQFKNSNYDKKNKKIKLPISIMIFRFPNLRIK